MGVDEQSPTTEHNPLVALGGILTKGDARIAQNIEFREQLVVQLLQNPNALDPKTANVILSAIKANDSSLHTSARLSQEKEGQDATIDLARQQLREMQRIAGPKEIARLTDAAIPDAPRDVPAIDPEEFEIRPEELIVGNDTEAATNAK